MRLLVMGGTVFLGRHLVEAAVARGHEVTMFNRGRSRPNGFPDVELVAGDREQDLGRLYGRAFDAVVDTSGYVPRVVRASAAALAGCAGHCTFVSSISAYGDLARRGLCEDDPLSILPEPGSEDVARLYGPLKAACEREVVAAFGTRALVVRPGLIVGPYDPTERFTYWVRRLGEPGRVLVPRATDQPVQLVDVRDLAAWMLDAAERRLSGVFNATGPVLALSFEAMIERVHAAVGGEAEIAWAAEQTLARAGVEPWSELPLWLDLERHPELRGFLTVDMGRALGEGLALRRLELTAADTLAWVRSRPELPTTTTGVAQRPAGLAADREAQLLRLSG